MINAKVKTMKKVLIDIISEDTKQKEWALYLVENGPWKRAEVEDRLRELQDRIYDAVDVALNGLLAAKYPESKGKKIRIQVDSYDRAPPDLAIVVRGIARHIRKDPDYQRDIRKSEFVKGIRIVSMAQNGLVP